MTLLHCMINKMNISIFGINIVWFQSSSNITLAIKHNEWFSTNNINKTSNIEFFIENKKWILNVFLNNKRIFFIFIRFLLILSLFHYLLFYFFYIMDYSNALTTISINGLLDPDTLFW